MLTTLLRRTPACARLTEVNPVPLQRMFRKGLGDGAEPRFKRALEVSLEWISPGQKPLRVMSEMLSRHFSDFQRGASKFFSSLDLPQKRPFETEV